MYSTDSRIALLAHEWDCLGVSAQRSRTSHGKTGNVMFAWRNFEERDMVRSCHESPTHGEPGEESEVRKKSQEKYTEVTSESFRRWALELGSTVF